MRTPACLTLAVALAACARGDMNADSAAPATVTPAATANLTPADIAGTWTVRAMLESSDSTLLTYELSATSDTSGWMTTFPSGLKVPARNVTFSGDSVVSEAGPFDSQLREGVRVRNTRSVMRMQDGKLIGTIVSHYDTRSADSVITLRTEGTRKP
jgi:hypothetical protein